MTLHPGGTAHVVLFVHDAGFYCAHPVTGTVRVFAPGQTRPQDTGLSVQACPHRRTMSVDAVGPHAGIPGYTQS